MLGDLIIHVLHSRLHVIMSWVYLLQSHVYLVKSREISCPKKNLDFILCSLEYTFSAPLFLLVCCSVVGMCVCLHQLDITVN